MGSLDCEKIRLVGMYTYRVQVRSRIPIDASDVQTRAFGSEEVELSKDRGQHFNSSRYMSKMWSGYTDVIC